MAMTPNVWYPIVISALATPPWTTSDYQAPPFVIDAIISQAIVIVFCVSDAGPGGAAVIAYAGGQSAIPSNAVTTSGPLSTNVTVMDDGETWYSVRRAGAWLFYGSSSGVVRSLASPAALGAFIS